jgi:UDP-N-acetylglucosamine diphosphorylase/glucosamine-1-phosphate N-acetyltransferase
MKKLAFIILAAGKGIRMKSNKPKVVFEFDGQPMINRVIKTARMINSEKIVVVVGYKKEMIIDVIPKDKNIYFIEQKEQNGTGHAVMVTRKLFENFDGDVFILCGDVPLLRYESLKGMLKKHRETNSACTILTAIMEDAFKYGRIVRNKKGNVLKIVEFKDASEKEKLIKEINTGIYCFDSKNLFSALSKINNKNVQKEYYLTDILEILNKENKTVVSVVLEDIIEASGVNSREQLSNLEKEYLKNKNYYDK